MHSTTRTSTTLSKTTRQRAGVTGVSNLSKNRRHVHRTVTTVDEEDKDVGRTSSTIWAPRACGCRDNPQKQNGATTPGFSGPFPSDSGVFGPPPLFVCCSPRWVESTSFFWQLGLSLFGMPARGPSRPLLVGYRVAALALGPPLPGGRRPLTHSPRREVVSGPAITEGAHPMASGRREGVALMKQWALLGS